MVFVLSQRDILPVLRLLIDRLPSCPVLPILTDEEY